MFVRTSHLVPGFTLNSVFRQKCKGTTGGIEISNGHKDVPSSLTILTDSLQKYGV